MSKNEETKQTIVKNEVCEIVKVWNDKNKYIGVRAVYSITDLIEISKTYDRYVYCR